MVFSQVAPPSETLAPLCDTSDSALTEVRGHGDAGRIWGGLGGRDLLPSWEGLVSVFISNSFRVQTAGDSELGGQGA